MDGLVTLLPEPFYKQVQDLWDELEARFDLRGVRITPFPHFSWQVAQNYDPVLLVDRLNQLTHQLHSFKVRTAGLGLFTSEHPTLFIPVVKSPQLVTFHEQIWQTLEGTASNLDAYYTPDAFVPHITLAFADLTNEKAGQVMEWLSKDGFNWEMQVDNLTYIHQPSGGIGQVTHQVKF